MIDFRENSPVVRDSPKAVNKHGDYKHELKEDFYYRCGYCNDSDHWTGGWRFFQIDHFVPRKYLVKISLTDYSNLVYSCFFCNNSKRAKWPSKNEDIAIYNDEGFVNPKDVKYIDHLCRDLKGNIIAKTPVGIYMIKEMKLDLKRHSVIWNLEKVEKIIDELKIEYEKASGKIPEILKDKIIQQFFEWHKYSKLLKRAGNE